MQVRVTFKTPDAVEDAINDGNFTDTDRRKLRKLAEKFFEFGEYVTIELDTDKGTATVVQVRK